MEETSQRSLTEGSVPKKMLLFALPIFFSNLFQQLYNAADSLIVGTFIGGEALAAVSSSGVREGGVLSPPPEAPQPARERTSRAARMGSQIRLIYRMLLFT